MLFRFTELETDVRAFTPKHLEYPLVSGNARTCAVSPTVYTVGSGS